MTASRLASSPNKATSAAAPLAVSFHLFVVCHEERKLRARFGEPYEPYEAYRRAVRRWLPGPRYRPAIIHPHDFM